MCFALRKLVVSQISFHVCMLTCVRASNILHLVIKMSISFLEVKSCLSLDFSPECLSLYNLVSESLKILFFSPSITRGIKNLISLDFRN